MILDVWPAGRLMVTNSWFMVTVDSLGNLLPPPTSSMGGIISYARQTTHHKGLGIFVVPCLRTAETGPTPGMGWSRLWSLSTSIIQHQDSVTHLHSKSKVQNRRWWHNWCLHSAWGWSPGFIDTGHCCTPLGRWRWYLPIIPWWYPERPFACGSHPVWWSRAVCTTSYRWEMASFYLGDCTIRGS